MAIQGPVFLDFEKINKTSIMLQIISPILNHIIAGSPD